MLAKNIIVCKSLTFEVIFYRISYFDSPAVGYRVTPCLWPLEKTLKYVLVFYV